MEEKRRKLTAKDLRRIKHEARKNYLYPPALPYSTTATYLKYQEVRDVQFSETWSKEEKMHKLKHQEWARKYLKTDFIKGFVGLMR